MSGPKGHRSRGPRPRRTTRRAAALREGAAGRLVASAARRLGPAARPARAVVGSISTLGWSVIVVAVFAWIGVAKLGWIEAVYIAAAATLLVGICGVLTIGRTLVKVTVELQPDRVTVGGSAAGRVAVTNVSRAPLLPLTLELPIGTQTARFELPTLGSGTEHEELFIIPTNRRGVIPVGPATTVRGDPFGLFGRAVAWTGTSLLYVHPRTVPLEPVGTGLLRDLEGQTTNEMSMSDLAFHTLRDYAPGDDRRYIHWRSSAKVGGGTPGGRFLVRQFLDSRRSHISLVVDSRATSYASEDALETAISAAASVALRATLDAIDLTVVVGPHLARDTTPRAVLDVFALAEVDDLALGAAALRCATAAPDTSLAVIVTGAEPDFREIQAAAAQFAPEVAKLVLRVDPGSERGGGIAGLISVRQIGDLDDLPIVLRTAI